MKLHLSKSQMLSRRRKAAGFEPVLAGCDIADSTGVDVDAIMEQDLRARYLELLDTAGEDFLAPVDVASGCTIGLSGAGCVLMPPATCRRLLRVRMAGWDVAAEVLPASRLAAERQRQANPFTAASAAMPVAVQLPGGAVQVWPESAECAEATGVVDDGPEVYHIDERAEKILCHNDLNPFLK